MDLERSMKKAINTGNVELGVNRAVRALMGGRAKLVICSKDCSNQELSVEDEIIHRLDMNSRELGRLCRKPFTVSALAVIDEGESDILRLAKGG